MESRRAAEDEVRIDRWVALACAACALACFVVALVWHPVPSDESAENDRFVLHAAKLLAGEWPRDPFRPQYYAAISALASLPFGDVFTGARLVSSVAFGGVLFCVYRIGTALGSWGVGLFAMLTLVASAPVGMFGLLAQSDMLFVACVLASIVCVAHRGDHRRLRGSLWAGAFAGLAFATRYQAALPIGIVALGLCCGIGASRGAPIERSARLREFGCFVLAATFVCLPQFALNWWVFGSPLYEEGWRNLAFKLDGGTDWTLLARDIEPGGWLGVAAGRWGSVWSGWWSELGTAWFQSVPSAFGGGIVGFGFVLVALLGWIGACWRVGSEARARTIVWIAAIGFVHVSATCLVFYGSLRQCLLAIVLVAPLACAGLWRCLPSAVPARARWAALGGLATLQIALAWSTTSPQVVERFVASHSVGVHRLARSLGAAPDRPWRVLGSHADLAPFYGIDYRNDLAIGGVYELGGVDDHYFEFLRWDLTQRPVDFVIFGRDAPGRRPDDLWRGEVALDFLELVRRAADAALYRVRLEVAPSPSTSR